jgi:hypothetical protein
MNPSAFQRLVTLHSLLSHISWSSDRPVAHHTHLFLCGRSRIESALGDRVDVYWFNLCRLVQESDGLVLYIYRVYCSQIGPEHLFTLLCEASSWSHLISIKPRTLSSRHVRSHKAGDTLSSRHVSSCDVKAGDTLSSRYVSSCDVKAGDTILTSRDLVWC